MFETRHARNERPVIGGVAQFLVNEGNPGDIDDGKPFLNFGRFAFADVDRKFCLGDQVLPVFIEAVEIARFPFNVYREGQLLFTKRPNEVIRC